MIAATISTIWASAATAETLKVAVAQRGFWNSSFIEFALQQGFFKQEGLDIEILYTEGGASTLTPVIAGSIDIAMTNGTLGAIAAFSWLAALEHSGDTDKRRRAQTLPAYAATKKWWRTQFAIEQISDLPRQVTST